MKCDLQHLVLLHLHQIYILDSWYEGWRGREIECMEMRLPGGQNWNENGKGSGVEEYAWEALKLFSVMKMFLS